MGLMFTLCMLATASSLQAQILRGVKKATDKVTKPMKDVQKSTKSVTKPIKDTRKGVQEIKRAPKEIKQEADRTKSEFDRAGSDIQKAGQDIKRTKDGLSRKKDEDSTQTKTTKTTSTSTNSGGTVVQDERTNREVAGANKRTTSTGSNNETIAPQTSLKARPRPKPKAKPATTTAESAGDRSVYLKPANDTPVNRPKAKPDYSKSPARYALERADFDTETLQDLFDNAVWDGPGRAHTMRSIAFHLKQLKGDLDEIKKIDPTAKVAHFDRQYKEWYAEYTRREREGQTSEGGN